MLHFIHTYILQYIHVCIAYIYHVCNHHRTTTHSMRSGQVRSGRRYNLVVTSKIPLRKRGETRMKLPTYFAGRSLLHPLRKLLAELSWTCPRACPTDLRRPWQYRKAPSDATIRQGGGQARQNQAGQVIATYRIPTQTMKLEE